MKKKITLGTAVMLILLAVVATANISYLMSWESFNAHLKDLRKQEARYAKLAEVNGYVDRFFVGEYDEQALLDGALKGYVGALGDKWSYYFTEDEYEMLQSKLDNEYQGIGISVTFDEEMGYIRVLSVFTGSPAEQAGIAPSDLILAVDGKDVAQMGYQAVSAMIQGQRGTQVILQMQRGRDGTLYDVTVTRANIQSVSVEVAVLPGNIGYVHIANFEPGMAAAFTQKVQELISAGAQGLIFDVRNNPGGTITVLTDILDMLLPEGTIISVQNKDGTEQTYVSDAYEVSMPMAVLVNAGTYSAAEFFAAALQEYEKAAVVGEKTTGKGFAQQIIPLSDGSALYISTSMYYTPHGVNLAKRGVTPDYEIVLGQGQMPDFLNPDPEQDSQLHRAMAVLANMMQ